MRKYLEEAIAHAQWVSNELSRLDDQLSALIPVVEEALRKMRIGVPLRLDFQESDAGADLSLRFHKAGGIWRLHIYECDSGQCWLLPNAPRDRRMLALAMLPKLIEGAATQLGGMVEERKRVIADTEALLETINGSTAAPSKEEDER